MSNPSSYQRVAIFCELMNMLTDAGIEPLEEPVVGETYFSLTLGKADDLTLCKLCDLLYQLDGMGLLPGHQALEGTERGVKDWFRYLVERLDGTGAPLDQGFEFALAAPLELGEPVNLILSTEDERLDCVLLHGKDFGTLLDIMGLMPVEVRASEVEDGLYIQKGMAEHRLPARYASMSDLRARRRCKEKLSAFFRAYLPPSVQLSVSHSHDMPNPGMVELRDAMEWDEMLSAFTVSFSSSLRDLPKIADAVAAFDGMLARSIGDNAIETYMHSQTEADHSTILFRIEAEPALLFPALTPHEDTPMRQSWTDTTRTRIDNARRSNLGRGH